MRSRAPGFFPFPVFMILASLAAAPAWRAACAGSGEAIHPYEIAGEFQPANPIDELTLKQWRKHGIEPANLCSDEVFVRRVYLDVIGALPEPQETLGFLNDPRPGKRARLIDALLEREEFAGYQALKWADLLRIKAEFPINLWPNAAQAYHRWTRDALRENLPCDQFARALLTSSGSNFRVPPVNFYRALQGRDAQAIAAAVALTFMGTRLESWEPEAREGFEAFFSRVAYKKTGEWKEEIVYLDPAATTTLEAVFPGGARVRIEPDVDPREVFADWLLAPENPWFARNLANRAWAWLMGRGIIHEPDDIRPGNPPSNPELLAFLEKELVDSGYDMRHLFRLILNSRTYQQSSIPRGGNPEAATLFACYPVRRLDAEVLLDALNRIGGGGESFSSAIPEPFTFIPEYHPAVELADGSISSQYLEMFGRPARDTGLESERANQMTDEQRLYLLNSNDIRKKIVNSPHLQRLFARRGADPVEAFRQLYLLILSREPTEAELEAIDRYIESHGSSKRQVAEDVAWALINTCEFLYRH